MIDVSQSVEADHPQSMDFLKRDCVNVNGFFRSRMEQPSIPVKKLFMFVVSKALPGGEATEEAEIASLLEAAADEEEDDIEEEVFVNTWIPSQLEQITDRAELEREIGKLKRGEELLYGRLLAENAQDDEDDNCDDEEEEEREEEKEGADPKSPRGDVPRPPKGEERRNEKDSGAESADGDSDEDQGSNAETGTTTATHDGHKPEGMSKAAWKAQVKEERAKKREEKVPKALKKKYRKQAAKGR